MTTVAQTPSAAVPAAARAFDAIAAAFDERFGSWASVAAQRRAVRRELLHAFPPDALLLELGGGTGEDALFLAQHGRRVVVTDGAPAMVRRTAEKARAMGYDDRVVARHLPLESFDRFVRSRTTRAEARFDGAYSNFAALNCVPDLSPLARGLACLLAPGAHAVVVMFGPFAPAEVLIELARGRPGDAFRRLATGAVPASIGGQRFMVWYPGPRAVAGQFAPYFRLVRTRGIGVFVPPSAAEPMISRFPKLLALLEWMDRRVAGPLARISDHMLLDFERADTPRAKESG
jgi:SAM-dependent methyltransferase